MQVYNPILDVDSYKFSHFLQYAPGVTHVSAYLEARGGLFPKTVFFGLQMFLQTYMSKGISRANIDEAEGLVKVHGLPFNRAGFERIVDVHGGMWPVRIEALPEGVVAPVGVALVQVVNTDPELAWVTTFIETMLLRAVWYPVTVATRSFEIKKVILAALRRTSDNPEAEALFKLHDFGARGVSSLESAAIGGLAHLVNFRGGDTMPAIVAARDYYDEPMAAFSIPAAEHSTITSWGVEGETEAYRNMVEQFGGDGKMFAVVSDSYDLYKAVRDIWGGELKSMVRDNGGTLVVRPDSGDPTIVPVDTVTMLGELFGTEINSKGFRVLPKCVRVIQGDGVNTAAIATILRKLEEQGYSAENIAFGMGGELLQRLDRDTCRFAMKASAVKKDGEWSDIFKSPATDQSKASKRGRLAVIERDGELHTMREDGFFGAPEKNLLQPVWEGGKLLRRQTLAEIRARVDRAQ